LGKAGAELAAVEGAAAVPSVQANRTTLVFPRPLADVYGTGMVWVSDLQTSDQIVQSQIRVAGDGEMPSGLK